MAPGQVPPVTAINVPVTLADGRITMTQTVFTQTFASVLDPLPTPASGSIGLGTLTGSVGAVRTEQAKSGAAAGSSSLLSAPPSRRPLASALVAGALVLVLGTLLARA